MIYSLLEVRLPSCLLFFFAREPMRWEMYWYIAVPFRRTASYFVYANDNLSKREAIDRQ